MGVEVYVLARNKVSLDVGGFRRRIATLRQYGKVSEIDHDRAAELDRLASKQSRRLVAPAAMVACPDELPLASEPDRLVKAHLVLAWEGGRVSVTDWNWDYLPKLGYAVRDDVQDGFVLHEERGRTLHRLSARRAAELGMLREAGGLTQRGQPLIRCCISVRQFIRDVVEAEVILDDGTTTIILTDTSQGIVPAPDWYVSKRPDDVVRLAHG